MTNHPILRPACFSDVKEITIPTNIFHPFYVSKKLAEQAVIDRSIAQMKFAKSP